MRIGYKEFTDAQIKALPTTELTVIPAPPTGHIILPVKAFVVVDNSAGAYTAVDPTTDCVLFFKQGGVNISEYKAGTVLSIAGNRVITYSFAANDWDDTYGGMFAAGTDLSSLNTASVTLNAINAINFTGGHADNKIKVHILYEAFSLTPYGG